MMTAFGFAVIKSIIHRKQVENHSWWLISTVFIIMMPALGRGVQNFYVGIHRGEWPAIGIMYPLYITHLFILLLIFVAAWKYGKIKHPGTWLAIAVNLFNFLLEPIGRSENVQSLLSSLLKG